METEEIIFGKTGENTYEAVYVTASDHDVLQATLPEGVGMSVYARVPGQAGKSVIGSVSSIAQREVLCELAVPQGLEIIIECSRKGAENVSAVVGKGE